MERKRWRGEHRWWNNKIKATIGGNGEALHILNAEVKWEDDSLRERYGIVSDLQFNA